MRPVLFFAAVPIALLGCSQDDDSNRNAEAAVAAGFKPPTVLARADFAMDLDKRFNRLDVNGDAILEPNEWPPRYADRLARLDKNKDGKVTRNEFFEAMMARFDAADTNRDQVLTSEERTAADIPRDGAEDDGDGDSSNGNNSAAAF
ncbi:hypothetical protein ACFO8O_08775 [Hephaestia sp. GCM10023244]|uniref:hypothetical protein n=1 Tax=unclassified Hephaestia TaxID=2631281 RepID=UPI002077395F|nr:hypothetical protein [Hephaestia sp. MAHUQ-44]MCM8731052.1 hypothetical protein [Hephaestia sp. MAHUQ-44]